MDTQVRGWRLRTEEWLGRCRYVFQATAFKKTNPALYVTTVSLACIGLYGKLSYSVTVRRLEVSLRPALGALQGKIVRQFLLQGLAVTFLGCAAGWALAAASSRALAGMLYGVSPSDFATLSTVVLLMLLVAALAALIPSLRAARVDPMQVLREE